MTSKCTLILRYLEKVEEATPTEVSKKTKIHYTAITYLLEDLVKKKIVSVRANEFGTFQYYKLEDKDWREKIK